MVRNKSGERAISSWQVKHAGNNALLITGKRVYSPVGAKLSLSVSCRNEQGSRITIAEEADASHQTFLTKEAAHTTVNNLLRFFAGDPDGSTEVVYQR